MHVLSCSRLQSEQTCRFSPRRCCSRKHVLSGTNFPRVRKSGLEARSGASWLHPGCWVVGRGVLPAFGALRAPPAMCGVSRCGKLPRCRFRCRSAKFQLFAGSAGQARLVLQRLGLLLAAVAALSGGPACAAFAAQCTGMVAGGEAGGGNVRACGRCAHLGVM